MSEKVVPTQWRERLTVDEIVPLKFKDKLKLLLGCSLRVRVDLLTQHKAGKIASKASYEVMEE